MCLLMSRNKKRIEMKKTYRSFVCHDVILERLDYKRIIRPVFPFDKDMKHPDLSVRFMKLSDEL